MKPHACVRWVHVHSRMGDARGYIVPTMHHALRAIPTRPSAPICRALEAIEAESAYVQYQAAPPEVAKRFGLRTERYGSTTAIPDRCASAFGRCGLQIDLVELLQGVLENRRELRIECRSEVFSNLRHGVFPSVGAPVGPARDHG